MGRKPGLDDGRAGPRLCWALFSIAVWPAAGPGPRLSESARMQEARAQSSARPGNGWRSALSAGGRAHRLAGQAAGQVSSFKLLEQARPGGACQSR
jgi:hypothetical protein